VKILHLSTEDKGAGGGGFDASYRLHINMLAAGVDSRMMVLSKNSSDPTVVSVGRQLTLVDKLRLNWARVIKRCLQFKLGASPYFHFVSQETISADRVIALLPFQPDVIIVHWVSNFLTARGMHLLGAVTKAPVLWHMMDMAPLTGGCHYAFDCRGYVAECGNCPQLLRGSGENDVSHSQWQLKYQNFKTIRVVAVTPTSWLKKQALESSLFRGRTVQQIMLGIDTDIFFPIPQDEVRHTLGLPQGRKIIFFGAHRLQEERKGIRCLLEALKKLHIMLENNPSLRENILVVAAGSDSHLIGADMPFECISLGLLIGDTMLAAGYQAADVFVNASIEDSGPMMVNEAILCGTPVVSFDMGVAPDLVHTGKTGYRARLKDSADMAEGLRILLEMDADAIFAMRQECRELGVRLCHPDVQVRAFMDLCASCISKA
jgi:glycosyltransferase involved in cell wall biosynthesis